MTHSFDGFNYLIRLKTGERLAESLLKFAAETDCDGAWLTGLGGATEAVIGLYSLEDKEYKWHNFEGMYEIAGLNGTIALGEDGKHALHLHGNLADKDLNVIGGHIKDLVAGATIEIFVHKAYKPMRRKVDPETGLKLLDLS